MANLMNFTGTVMQKIFKGVGFESLKVCFLLKTTKVVKTYNSSLKMRLDPVIYPQPVVCEYMEKT